MRQRATARDSGGFAILDRQLAVDDDEAHAGREQCRMGEIGAWREGRRVEGDDVGEGTGLQRSAPVESEQLRGHRRAAVDEILRSEEHTSELQSLMRISYAVFCLKKKNTQTQNTHQKHHN